MIGLDDDQVLLPEATLTASPSRLDGIAEEEENQHRILGCEMVQEAGILLRLPQVVMATGQNILHRFFYRKSLSRFDVFTAAMGCILLSCKVEEQPKALREILFVFHHMYQKRKKLVLSALELGGERYNKWKDELLKIEGHILKELGFSLYNLMDHPHNLRLDLSLRYSSREIACAAIMMAVRRTGTSLPSQPPWWNLMTENVGNVYQICERILTLYTLPKLCWLEPIAKVSYLSPEVCRRFDVPAPSVSAATSLGGASSDAVIAVTDSKYTVHETANAKDKGVVVIVAESGCAVDSNHRCSSSDSQEVDCDRETLTVDNGQLDLEIAIIAKANGQTGADFAAGVSGGSSKKDSNGSDNAGDKDDRARDRDPGRGGGRSDRDDRTQRSDRDRDKDRVRDSKNGNRGRDSRDRDRDSRDRARDGSRHNRDRSRERDRSRPDGDRPRDRYSDGRGRESSGGGERRRDDSRDRDSSRRDWGRR